MASQGSGNIADSCSRLFAAAGCRINPMQLVSHLAAPQLGVVLLGDAAHNVTPQMGQVSQLIPG
jgi:2-polyprenyl-6-methoxyphenol hydroxylase-like FAD-dependent oxidoreductase